ncbi:hypothetical protein R1sor_026752 [Riccia sorocarpa]|uniref:Uncharacterized protein n=1 Tax=Riccia sorocarpa TaxID=122646 RepID=A0ABD3GI12_9MARC
MEDLEERRKQQKRDQQRKRRYDNAVNPLRVELLAMRKEAENAAEEIRRKALEEAESIRSSARLLTEALSCGPSSLTLSREVPHTVPVGNAVSVASELLKFAQEYAVETRAEATKVLMDARAEAEQIVCSARSNATAITSSSSASVLDELKRFRERDATRKRERYWEIRGRDTSKDSASNPVQSRSSSQDRGDRTIRRIVTELVDTFEQIVQKFSLKKKFRLHKEKLYGGINEVRRFFWEVKVGEVNRSKRYDCLPIEGTRKLHCFYGFNQLNPTLLKVREMCCFCPSCIDEDWENCTKYEYTGPLTLHNVHPRKPADVIDYVGAIGHGQGIGDQWEEGTIADVVEVGDFFAVEAEWPNDFSAEFWILQCRKPLHALVDTITDAYGETHEEGSCVLEGIWYQQFGKSPTCFVRYDSAPLSVVASERVIHVRFALHPTGVSRNSPSFKLSSDTLGAILASLQRYEVSRSLSSLFMCSLLYFV